MTNFSMIDELNEIVERLKKIEMVFIADGQLVPFVKAVRSVGMYAATIDAEIHDRAVEKQKLLPGVTVERAVTHRVWEDESTAEALAKEAFGDDSYTKKLKSPAAFEKMGPKGKQLVSVAAVKPEGDLRAKY